MILRALRRSSRECLTGRLPLSFGRARSWQQRATRREFERLPISVAAAVLETLEAIAEHPKRLGDPLLDPLPALA